MSITEVKKEVKVYNVYATCNELVNGVTCTGDYVENVPFLVWDNKGTVGDLSDDTFEYSYICDICSKVQNSQKKYPYQEFVEI